MKAVVTGGGGFLGSAIVRQLRARGDEVVAVQRGAYPALDALGAKSIRADLADLSALLSAFQGADVVFHVAAKAGVWGRYEDYHAANVTGTENVIEACRQCRVPRLVFTSTPSVVFNGRDEDGITESAPYPRRYIAHYPKTKAVAEQLVLRANSPALNTVALRPHLIWGPGDPHLVPRILDRARSGRLRLVRAAGKRVDSTFIENAAAAHLLAASAPSAACAGKAYFISNGEPLAMLDLVTRILRAANLQPIIPTVPAPIAYATGCTMELMHTLLGLRAEPLLTRFVARQLSCSHWYDISAARRDLGYQPLISIDEGMVLLARSLAGRTQGTTQEAA